MKDFSIEHNFIETLTEEESRSVVGGGPGDDLVNNLMSRIFYPMPGMTTSSPIYTQFKSELLILADTPVGAQVLQQILNAGVQIGLSPDGPGSGAIASYVTHGDGSARQITLGNLQTGSDTASMFDFSVLAHELYHAYEDVVQKQYGTPYWNSVQRELDAYLYAYMADTEVDQQNDRTPDDYSGSFAYLDPNIFKEAGQQAAKGDAQSTQFYQAWYDMFKNDHFTTANYNTLIANFHAADVTHGYDNLTNNTIADINSSPLNQVVGEFHSTPFYTSPVLAINELSSSGASGGGGVTGNDQSGAGGIVEFFNSNGSIIIVADGFATSIPGSQGSSAITTPTGQAATFTSTGNTQVGDVHGVEAGKDANGNDLVNVVDSQGTVIGTYTIPPAQRNNDDVQQFDDEPIAPQDPSNNPDPGDPGNTGDPVDAGGSFDDPGDWGGNGSFDRSS